MPLNAGVINSDINDGVPVAVDAHTKFEGFWKGSSLELEQISGQDIGVTEGWQSLSMVARNPSTPHSKCSLTSFCTLSSGLIETGLPSTTCAGSSNNGHGEYLVK